LNINNIAESQWVSAVEGQTVSSLASERVILRKITGVNIKDLPDLVEALRLRVSVLNPDNGQKFYSVKNPLVNNVEQTGTWRCISVKGVDGVHNPGRTDSPAGTIIQELRYGLITAIETDCTKWSESRLVEGANLLESESYRTVRWVGCDPTKVNAIALTLNASTYVAPKINGESTAGTWHNIKVVPSLADDGSGIITLYLAQPEYTLTAYRNILTAKAEDISYLFQVPKDLAQGLITAHKATKGNSASASYSNAAGLVDIVLYSKNFASAYSKADVVTEWDCAHKEFTTTYACYTEAQADAIVLTEPPVGWTYQARKIDNGDGNWDVIVIKRNTLARTYSYVTVEEGNLDKTQMKEQIGVAVADVETVAEIDGAIVSQQRRHNDDCTVNAITDKKTGKVISKTSYDHDHLVKRTIVENTLATTDLTEPSPATGQAVAVVNEPSPFKNRSRTKQVTEVAQTKSIAEYVQHYGERSTDYISEEIHNASAPTITDQTASGIETAILSYDLDKFLTYNYKKMRSVKKFPFNDVQTWVIYGDYELATSQAYSATLGRYWNNKTYVYQRKATYTKKYFKTEAEAIAYIGGTFLTDNSGSHYGHSGEFEWFGVKVVNTKSLVTTYTYLEPTS
jgi:hypothetical protein